MWCCVVLCGAVWCFCSVFVGLEKYRSDKFCLNVRTPRLVPEQL